MILLHFYYFFIALLLKFLHTYKIHIFILFYICLYGVLLFLIKTLKLNKKIFLFFIVSIFLVSSIMIFYSFAENIEESNKNEKNFITWVDFNITSDVLKLTAKLDIDSHNNNEKIKYNWIELLSYLACKNYGNFKNFKKSDLNNLIDKLQNGENFADLTANMKYYNYYFESYSAVLSGFIGDYSVEKLNEDGSKSFVQKYGIKAFLPIAKNYNFSHYDDFGNSRSYGFKRTHLGNDLMGSIGTPIVAVESGVIEHLGWNQYGGWRIGIRSFDEHRYYYYAHYFIYLLCCAD